MATFYRAAHWVDHIGSLCVSTICNFSFPGLVLSAGFGF